MLQNQSLGRCHATNSLFREIFLQEMVRCQNERILVSARVDPYGKEVT